VVGVGATFLTLPAAEVSARRTTAAAVAMPLIHLSANSLRSSAVSTLRRVDGCTASTTAEREWLEGHGVASTRIAVLPPGCDPDVYPDITPTEARAAIGLAERPTIGYLGRLARHKGIDVLLDALPKLWADHPEVGVLIAGSNAGWAELDVRLDGLEASSGDRLSVRRAFRDDERPTLLAACDVVAFPSREESFGMVTIEAWCARRPVVAGDIEAVRSLIRPGQDGELVPVGDVDQLAAAVSSLLDDEARRRGMGSAGRIRAEREFSWSRVVDDWDAFLRETVSRSAREQR
jgi:glycosyltransferase involved in cell wall biosynthesis